MKSVEELLAIMRRLRDPQGGCPWDLQQDFCSIAPFTIEEAYEVADVIEREAWEELPGELGDLLFQVVFHAQMAQERGWFGFEEVARAMADKLVRRHPHVFGDGAAHTAEEQTRSWEAIKAEERKVRSEGGEASALDDIGLALPALTRAVKLSKRAARVGFDWPDHEGVLDKVREEIVELEEELQHDGDQERVAEELGDLLFAVSNLARHLKVDPEQALRAANAKFEKRFRGVEALMRERGRAMDTADLDELEGAWQAVKRKERTGRE